MSKKRYTEEQVEAAKEYLRQRIDDEASMRTDVDNLLRIFIPWLVALLVRGASQSEIDALLEELEATLIDDCEMLAIDEHDDEYDALLLFLHQRIGDKTFDERISERVHTLYDEVFTVVMIGLLLGKSERNILSTIIESMATPWQNPILVEFREKVQKGEVAVPEGVDINERHYGKGVPVSSFVALTDITVYGVSSCWSQYDYLAHKDTAAGFYVYRGSTFPCDECDSHVGFHTIDDVGALPLYHNHCMCYVVWV